MNQRLNPSMIAIVCMLLFPLAALAQLPNPTYGWNLGNTLEPPSGEGTWGPAATQSLINAVADAGFTTIRIPCAWDSNANQTTYQINATYMNRVKQVVDWCYARNLTVIINCHWDGGWLENNIGSSVDPTINNKMQSYWTQIANAFAGYDSRLLFAGANEPAVDTAAQMATLTAYYQTFVNAVRATGGQNTNRWLIVQGPSTNIDKTDSLMNTLPTDPTPGRLMVEVHEYDPFNFTLMTTDESWGNMSYFWGTGYHHATRTDRNTTWGEEAHFIAQFEKMKTKFVNQGIPVVVGEFGAVKRIQYSDLTGADLDLHLASRTYFNKYIVDTANSMGLKPVYWDAGGTGKNTMWLFDRSTAQVIDQPLITALTGGPALIPPGMTAPTAPGNLAVTATFDTQVSLSWADNSSNEAVFEIQRATNSTFTTNVVTTTVAANTTSTSVNGLTASTTYYFRVRATNPAGASAYTNTVTTTTQAPAPHGSGSISQELWTNVSGITVSSIPVGTTPNQTGTLTSFEGPTNWADSYGQRVRGYLTAPVTGSYTFWIAGDDNCELWLSTSSDAAGKVRIAYHNDWTGSREWSKYATQKSAAINLVAGTRYYIEALQKEGSGGDCLAVGWAKPGQGTTAPSEVIPGTQLSPWDGVQVTVPAAPSSLTASAVSTSQINLAWADNSSNETGFKVDRALNSAFTSGLVTTTVGANVSSFQATGLARNTVYYFRVRAYNADGDSANSNTANARTKAK